MVHRLRTELAALRTRDRDDAKLLELAIAAERDLRSAEGTSDPARSILVPVGLSHDGVAIELFTTITTVGTPLDITLQELRIETLFPANAAARAWLAGGLD